MAEHPEIQQGLDEIYPHLIVKEESLALPRFPGLPAIIQDLFEPIKKPRRVRKAPQLMIVADDDSESEEELRETGVFLGDGERSGTAEKKMVSSNLTPEAGSDNEGGGESRLQEEENANAARASNAPGEDDKTSGMKERLPTQ